MTSYIYRYRGLVRLMLCLISLAMLVSCLRERFDQQDPESSEDISILVNEVKPLTTKSGQKYMDVVYSADSTDIYLEVIESDMAQLAIVQDTTQTKGAPYVGNNIGKFSITAFLDSDYDKPYFSLSDLTSDGSAVGTGYYWPITTPETTISFFGCAKNQDSGIIENLIYYPANTQDANYKGAFSYTLPSPDGDNTSAVEQPDLLFAIAPNQKNTGSAVGINFHHALTSIVFKVGSIPADFIVESVEFTNLSSSGSCEYYSDAQGALTFDWNGNTPKNFSQDFNKKMSDANGNVTDEAINTTEQTFMIIPGDLSDASELIITVSFYKGENKQKTTYQIRKSLKSILSTWTAGKQYTYRISSPEEIQVDVTDKLVDNNTKKQELEIRNNGLAPSYMRAVLVGYWVVPGATEEDDLIVGQWRQAAINATDDASDDGVFEPAADFNNNWIVGSDGYYYYKHPVPSGETTTDLFTSYTVTGNPPVVAAELILSVAVQAVIESKIEQTGWPVKLDSDGKTLKNQ